MDETERVFREFLKRGKEDEYDTKKMWISNRTVNDIKFEKFYEPIKGTNKYRQYTDVTELIERSEELTDKCFFRIRN